jgi:hypothetical protein
MAWPTTNYTTSVQALAALVNRNIEKGYTPNAALDEQGIVYAVLANLLQGRQTQAITAAGAINPDADYVAITGPASSTYAVTLAVPTAAQIGKRLILEMVATTSTNAVTLTLTNVVIGGTAATTATFDAARESLIMEAVGDRWVVIKQQGVTLS